MPRWMPSISAATRSILNGTIRCTHGPQSSNSYFCLSPYGVYFIFKSMEQGPSFRVTVPKFPTKDPNHRILARQKSRFTHDYFYIRDEVLGPFVMRVEKWL